jgi:hypothetical protein
MILGLLIPIATPLSRYFYHRFFGVFVLGAVGVGAIMLEQILSNDRHREQFSKWLRFVAWMLGAIAVLLTFITIGSTVWHTQVMEYAIHVLAPRLQHAAFAEGNELWLRSRIEATVQYFSIMRFEWLAALLSWALILFAFFRWKSQRLSERWVLISIWVLTTFQLILFARSWLPMTDTAKFPPYPQTAETDLLQSRTGLGRTCFFRQIEPNHQTIFVDNQAVMYGIPEATGYESLTPRCLYNVIGVDIDSATIRLLSRFNVATIGATHSVQNDLLHPILNGPIWMYDISVRSPRVFLSSHVETVANDSIAVARLRSNEIHWPAAIFTPEEGAKPIESRIDSAMSVTIDREDANELILSTRSGADSYLLVTDTYYPGWVCELDGQETRILRCNYAMRAVYLPAGKHHVMFRFQPSLFRSGLVISGITAIALLLPLLGFRKIEKRRPNNFTAHL